LAPDRGKITRFGEEEQAIVFIINVAAALVAARIVDNQGGIYKHHATHKGWRYIIDDQANIHRSSIVAS
jgi:cell division protein FtsL